MTNLINLNKNRHKGQVRLELLPVVYLFFGAFGIWEESFIPGNEVDF